VGFIYLFIYYAEAALTFYKGQIPVDGWDEAPKASDKTVKCKI